MNHNYLFFHLKILLYFQGGKIIKKKLKNNKNRALFNQFDEFIKER